MKIFAAFYNYFDPESSSRFFSLGMCQSEDGLLRTISFTTWLLVLTHLHLIY